VNDLVATRVFLLAGDDTNTTGVMTTSGHDKVADLELGEVSDLVGGEVNDDGVVDLDVGVGVADSG